MFKRQVKVFERDTAEYVVAHAKYKKNRGKGPSMSYRGEKNPRKALILAMQDVATTTTIVSPDSVSLRHSISIKEKMPDFQLYLAMKQIADMAYDYARTDSVGSFDIPWLDDRRGESVNPYYSQTRSGLFLELYYGIPGKIWTPWGCWGCWGSGSGCWGDKMDKFLERLGATIFQEKTVNGMGEFGPVYALHRVDDIILPLPEVKQHNRYLSYKQAKSKWKKLTQRYYELRDEQVPMSYEQRVALDQIILETRGKYEPKLCTNDICSLEQLKPYRGIPIKYTNDGGRTWNYCRLYHDTCEFDNGSFGYPMDAEVMPNVSVHCRGSITDKDFSDGLIVRLATVAEVQNIAFSYD